MNGALVSDVDGDLGVLGTGTAVVTGTGSTWKSKGYLNVGQDGAGSLTINNGGSVSCAFGEIAAISGSIGNVLVDGVNSRWEVAQILNIGPAGNLAVRNGGTVFAETGAVNGVVLIDGVESGWIARNDLLIGSAGTGFLTVENGGLLSNRGLASIGTGQAEVGIVLVDGTGSTWTIGDRLLVGFIGMGMLTIGHGGTVSTAGSGGIAADLGSHGIVNVDGSGSEWIINGPLYVGGGDLGVGGIPGGEGLLRIVNGGKVAASNTTIFATGTVIDDGLLSSNILIAAGGQLAGSGKVFGSAVNSGIVSPGHLIGSLSIADNYQQSASGMLRTQIAGLNASQHDLLSIGGGAQLDGTLRLVRLNNFAPRPGDIVSFLTASGGVNGTFATVSSDFAGTIVTPELVYGSNRVALQFVQGSFASLSGLTTNQQAVAANLDQVVHDPRTARLIDFLDTELLTNLPHDYDLIAPEELASIYEMGFSQATVQSINLERRMDDIRAGANGFSAAGFTPRIAGRNSEPEGKGTTELPRTFVPSPDNRWGMFVTGAGDFVNVGNDDPNARGYDITTGGFTLGLDYRVSASFAIGIDAGYARSEANLTDHGDVTADGGKVGLFATYFNEGFYLDGAVGGGWNSYDTRRAALLSDARGETSGGEFNGVIGGGYDYTWRGWTFGPLANLQYTKIVINDFTEDGSLAPLHLQNQDEDSFRSTLGMKLSRQCKLGPVVIKPEVRASWQHEFGDTSYPINSRFASGAGNVFTVHGPKIGRDSALISAGLNMQWNTRTSTYLYYDGQLGRNNYDSHSISGGVQVTF